MVAAPQLDFLRQVITERAKWHSHLHKTVTNLLVAPVYANDYAFIFSLINPDFFLETVIRTVAFKTNNLLQHFSNLKIDSHLLILQSTIIFI